MHQHFLQICTFIHLLLSTTNLFKMINLYRKIMKLEFSGNGVALEKCSIIYSNDDQNFKFERGENSKRNIHKNLCNHHWKKNFSSGWECISLEDWNSPVFAPSLYFFLWTFDLGHLGHCSLSPHVLYFILRLIDAIKKKQDHISHSPRILGNATYYEQNMICSIIV